MIVALAQYYREPGRDDAEVAFLVDDGYQGHGIGTILLEHLASEARRHGIRQFAANTLTENHKMLKCPGRSRIRAPVPTQRRGHEGGARYRVHSRRQGCRRCPGPDGGHPVHRSCPGAALDRRGGCGASEGNDRARAVAQPARRRIRGSGLPRESLGLLRRQRSVLAERGGDPRPSRPGGDRRTRARRCAGHRRLRGERRVIAGGDHGGIRGARMHRAPMPNTPWPRWPTPRECGWWAPTASESSTPIRPCR